MPDTIQGSLPRVCFLTCTCGRHTLLERSAGLYLQQDYSGDSVQLIFNNSIVPQELSRLDIPPNKEIIVINKGTNRDGNPYSTLGEIYEEAVRFVPDDCEVISFLDDDDIVLPNHAAEGIKGYLKAKSQGKVAYKPSTSWYRSSTNIALVSNTLEPSIFVDSNVIYQVGFHNTTSDQHLKWVNYLTTSNGIYVDPNGVPTLVYNWGDSIPTWKTSGDPNNPENFNNYRNYSQDHGDHIITPSSREELAPLFDELKKYIKV